jgi:hypothetical protein
MGKGPANPKVVEMGFQIPGLFSSGLSNAMAAAQIRMSGIKRTTNADQRFLI